MELRFIAVLMHSNPQRPVVHPPEHLVFPTVSSLDTTPLPTPFCWLQTLFLQKSYLPTLDFFRTLQARANRPVQQLPEQVEIKLPVRKLPQHLRPL
mmetsp:Transcript_24441/g.49531  ORF Transcript_24441/g.49531 Transcript_24441/m.49531 type:complete len:96 (-) Transcript_24441:900-1187(-)